MDFVLTSIQNIGATLGIPIAIVLVIIFMTLKQHSQRLDEGDSRMTKIESEARVNEALLQEIRANVAFIKGKMDK